MHNNVYIIDAIRSPIGRPYGRLSSIRPDDLITQTLQNGIQKNKIVIPEHIEGLYLGCANQAGEDNRNIARMAVLLTGWSPSIHAVTHNSLCTSGMDSIMDACRRIALGEADMLVAGGVESMSRSPFIENRTGNERVDSTVGWRFINPILQQYYQPLEMANTASLLAKKMKISRQEQDKYAFRTREAYQKAWKNKHYEAEIVPIQLDEDWYKKDEQHRLLKLKMLQKLPEMTPEKGGITVGNAARLGDGAAWVALASEAYIRAEKIQPLAKIVTWANSAAHPNDMGISHVEAVRKTLKKSAISMQQIQNIEMSEAFAAQVLASTKMLDCPINKINPNGGEISMGKPLGMSGTRLVVSLCHSLNSGYGIATACAGLGVGSAILIEKL